MESESILAAIAQLQRLSELFQKRRQQLADGVGLTEQQWAVLEEISSEHFMPSMFARQRDSSAAAVSKILRQLVDKELVQASVGETDARQRTYDLTPKGKRVLGRLRQARREAVDQVWTKLDPSLVRGFNDFASELAPALERLLLTNQRK